MRIRSLLADIRRRLARSAPLIEIRISESALLHNLRTYQSEYPGMKLAPVLKSNAYGHGLGLVARLLDREPIAFFMVDSLYEARYLRWSGIRSRILVMGYVRPDEVSRTNLKNVDFAITSLAQLQALIGRVTRPTRIHLKLDTGMHRQGLMEHEVESALTLLSTESLLRVVGVGTHLGDADNKDESVSRAQLAVWKRMLSAIETACPSLEYRHFAATKGVRFSEEAGADTIRLGIGLYGIDTSPHNALQLRPVLSMHSLIASIREIPEGDTVGYNATYRAPAARRIALVPAGYFEGVDRRLSGKGAMRVSGHDCPIVGRVSMNMTSIDVTDLEAVGPGAPVEVISDCSDNPNSIEQMARLADTTPYVLFAHIPQHLRRVVGK